MPPFNDVSLWTIYVLLTFLLIVAAIIDFRVQKIPNILTFPAILVFLVYHGATAGFQGLRFSSLGLITGIGLLLPIYLFGGMGAGDAKLMGAIGAAIGTRDVFEAFLFTGLFGGVYALIILYTHRQQCQAFISRHLLVLKTFFFTRQFIPVPAEKNEIRPPRLCYGLAISAGTMTQIILKITGYSIIPL